jgi:hypothetical protein
MHPHTIAGGRGGPGSRRRTRLAPAMLPAAVVLAAALVLGACGTVSKLTTGRAISESVTRIGSQSGVSLRFSIGVDQSQVQQIAQKGGGRITPAEAQALATGSVFFSEETGHGEALDSPQAATDPADSVDFGVQVGNDVPIEVRYVQQALYARLDFTTLLADTGQDPAKARSIAGFLAQGNAYVPGLAALGQGKWVEVTPAALKALSGMLNQYAGTLGGSKPSKSQIRAMVTALRNDLVNSIKDNSTYKNLGTQNGETEYGLTIDVHGFVNQFGPALERDLDSVPGGLGTKAAAGLKRAEAKIPAGQTVVLDLFVQDNKVSEVDVDLNQFAGKHKMPFPVPLKLNISTPLPITAPAGATPLDLSKLPQLIGGLFSGLGHSSGAAQ